MDEKALKEIAARAERARQEIYALSKGAAWKGGRGLTMSIPPRKDWDSDFVLLAPCDDIDVLIELLRECRETIAWLLLALRAGETLAATATHCKHEWELDRSGEGVAERVDALEAALSDWDMILDVAQQHFVDVALAWWRGRLDTDVQDD